MAAAVERHEADAAEVCVARLGDSRMLKYVLLGLAILYVVWTIYKAVMNWTERRKERKH